MGTRIDGSFGFVSFDVAVGRAEGKADCCGDFHVRFFEVMTSEFDASTVHTDGVEGLRARFVTEFLDIGAGGVRLQQGVVDETSEFPAVE